MMGRRQVTQKTLAEAVGVSQPQMSARVHGRLAWSIDDLYAVADALGCDVTDLLPSRATTHGYLHPAQSEWGLAA